VSIPGTSSPPPLATTWLSSFLPSARRGNKTANGRQQSIISSSHRVTTMVDNNQNGSRVFRFFEAGLRAQMRVSQRAPKKRETENRRPWRRRNAKQRRPPISPPFRKLNHTYCPLVISRHQANSHPSFIRSYHQSPPPSSSLIICSLLAVCCCCIPTYFSCRAAVACLSASCLSS